MGELRFQILKMTAVEKENQVKRLWKRYEYAAVLLLLVTLVFGILIGTGTLTSGLHLVDDHEYLEYDLIRRSGGSLGDCLRFALSEDVGLRFRPMYFSVRVLLYGLFGTNLVAWSVEKRWRSSGRCSCCTCRRESCDAVLSLRLPFPFLSW